MKRKIAVKKYIETNVSHMRDMWRKKVPYSYSNDLLGLHRTIVLCFCGGAYSFSLSLLLVHSTLTLSLELLLLLLLLLVVQSIVDFFLCIMTNFLFHLYHFV